MGHISTDCPRRRTVARGEMRRTVEPASGGRGILNVNTLDDEGEGRCQAKVGMGKIKIRALVDSGANVSTIRTKIAGLAGTPRFVKGTLHGFGGAKVEVNTKRETRIQLDDIEVVADLWEDPMRHNQ